MDPQHEQETDRPELTEADRAMRHAVMVEAQYHGPSLAEVAGLRNGHEASSRIVDEMRRAAEVARMEARQRAREERRMMERNTVPWSELNAADNNFRIADGYDSGVILTASMGDRTARVSILGEGIVVIQIGCQQYSLNTWKEHAREIVYSQRFAPFGVPEGGVIPSPTLDPEAEEEVRRLRCFLHFVEAVTHPMVKERTQRLARMWAPAENPE